MENKNKNQDEFLVWNILMYLVVIISLVYFIKGILELIDNGYIWSDRKTGFILSTVLLISFLWYKFVINKKKE